ncbi:carbonic anhydrase 2-like isoform X1 [Limulus polyphemus]|uniref:Carbonic anhydrase n=1 Tax=Limulus polyphemus TaxID=6850 RepID=A0ABM1BNS7_LIMPO|nr:carbonic anhydrase 2-like isoform X1 [Limulus polyphemus]
MQSDWGYELHNGPATWSDKFPAAAGSRQSPINLDPSVAIVDPTLNDNPLKWDYSSVKCTTLLNTGHGWKVQVSSASPNLDGGPLSNKYQLIQFHCHWGKNSETGSEHTVAEEMFPAEIHLVHWNSEKYESFEKAASEEDGLAVLGIFLQVGDEHPELRKLSDLMPSVRYKDDKLPLPRRFDPATLIPNNKAYWTYPGSLTTPPCYESVTWIVFKNSVQVSEDQLEAFRKLQSYCEGQKPPGGELNGCIVENYRPPLPLGNRELRTAS